MTDTPRIPADGSCVECGKERKMPASRVHRQSARLDPFCSSECARAWYGVDLPSARYSTSGNAPGFRRVGPRSFDATT